MGTEENNQFETSSDDRYETAFWAFAVVFFVLLGGAVIAPNFVKARSTSCGGPLCIVFLKQIDGAKSTWALENQKEPTDTPTKADLYGTDRYIREELECDSGGVITIGSVGEEPTCSYPGHVMNPPPPRPPGYFSRLRTLLSW